MKQRAALEKRDAEEAAEALACAFAFREEVRRASALPGTPRGRKSILSADALGTALHWAGEGAKSSSGGSGGDNDGGRDSYFDLPAHAEGPRIMTIEAQKRAGGISIEMASMHENPLHTDRVTGVGAPVGGGGGGDERAESTPGWEGSSDSEQPY